MNTTRAERGPSLNAALFEGLPVEERGVLEGKTFRRMIAIERKRTERSKEPFLLMLIEPHNGKLVTRQEPYCFAWWMFF